MKNSLQSLFWFLFFSIRFMKLFLIFFKSLLFGRNTYYLFPFPFHKKMNSVIKLFFCAYKLLFFFFIHFVKKNSEKDTCNKFP